MSYTTSIFAISETYNLAEKTCQIKDAIISRDFIIIRTTNINITEKENTAVQLNPAVRLNPAMRLNPSHPSEIKSMPKIEVANINISGEKYMLEYPVFINFYCNTNVVTLTHGNNHPPKHIFNNVISELALITHFASNKLYLFYCEIYNKKISTEVSSNSLLNAFMPNIKLTIDDIAECGIFETDYIDKLNALKKYINRGSSLHNLYNLYRPKYGTHLREIQKIQSDMDAFTKVKDDLKIANAERAQLQQEIQKIKNEHVMLKAIEKEEFETTVNAEIKKIWETIALMQYKASSHF